MAGSSKTVDDVLRLMAGMAECKVAVLEWDGLKIALAPQHAAGGTPAASSIAARPPTTAQEALKQAQLIRLAAQEQQEAAARAKTARSRVRAASGPPLVGDLVADVYDAVRHTAPVNLKVEASALSPEVP
jgi:hypothetical protein